MIAYFVVDKMVDFVDNKAAIDRMNRMVEDMVVCFVEYMVVCFVVDMTEYMVVCFIVDMTVDKIEIEDMIEVEDMMVNMEVDIMELVFDK